MAVLSIAQARAYASSKGFTGDGLDKIVAIAQAESGLDTNAVNTSDPNGGSFGILQINAIHFGSGITQAQALDPAAAFQFAYQLSSGGTDFHDWSTYTSGAYKSTEAWRQANNGTQAATNAGSLAAGLLWGPAKSLSTWPWLTKDGVSVNNVNTWDGSSEKGVDIGTPFHTTITSLTSGHVIRAFFGTDINPAYQYGGVVLVASVLPGRPGIQAVYYLHLDEIHVKAGDVLVVGQDIGLSGGQTTGGSHPASTQFSTGPHSEVGINNPDFAPQGGAPGPNVDPLPWLNNLVQKGPPAGDQIGSAASDLTGKYASYSMAYAQALSNQIASGTGPVGDSFAAIESRLDLSMQFIPIDWQTLTANVKWWQVALPWQWGSAADQVGVNVGKAVGHDVSAFALRALVVIAGFALLTAFLWGVTSSALRATGADQAIGQGLKVASLAGPETAAVTQPASAAIARRQAIARETKGGG